MRVPEDDEHLVGEALADPAQAGEIQFDLPEAVQLAAQALCRNSLPETKKNILRTGSIKI